MKNTALILAVLVAAFASSHVYAADLTNDERKALTLANVFLNNIKEGHLKKAETNIASKADVANKPKIESLYGIFLESYDKLVALLKTDGSAEKEIEKSVTISNLKISDASVIDGIQVFLIRYEVQMTYKADGQNRKGSTVSEIAVGRFSDDTFMVFFYDD